MSITTFFEKQARQAAQPGRRSGSALIMAVGLALVIALVLTRNGGWENVRFDWLIGGYAGLIGAANLVRSTTARWILSALAFAASLFLVYAIYHMAA